MQGLVSYSDDEDEQQQQQPYQLQRPPPGTTTTTRAVASSTSARRPVASHPPPSSKLAYKNQLPNLVRRQPAASSHAGPSSSAATASPSAFANSPLRRPLEPSPDSTPTRLTADRNDSFGDETKDEAAILRRLLRPPPLQNGEGWDDEYGLRRLGEDAKRMARETDPALQARLHKVSTFLSLKAQGTHFNDSLMKSRSFRNPTIYKKLVEFVDVDERRGLLPGIWEWEAGERDNWTTDRIADRQKERSERLTASQEAGKRDRIGFTSTSSSRSGPTLKRPPAVVPALAPVQSGGKAFPLVDVDGDPLDGTVGGKRERERDGRDGDRKRGQTGYGR